jgi:DNA-binding transcriptional ArsR family regulator
MGEFDDELYEVLTESPKAVAKLLKSAAHQGRVKILSLLLKGRQGLSNLVKETGLSKNAVVNHLSMLIENELVQRADRGEYTLTIDGRELISAVATLYRSSAVRVEEQRRWTRKMYTGDWRGEGLSEIMIGREAEYQPCWISYTGAMAGALRSLGVDCDITDVGGYSGYAFIVNVIKGEFCPSGPTALHMETWRQIHRGTQDLGWEIEHWFDEGSYPEEEGASKPHEVERARKLYEITKDEIEKDRPVVLWGLHIPEYGIVNGIKGNSYVTSSCMGLMNTVQLEEPALYYELKAPGCLDAYFFKEQTSVVTDETDKKAVERALKFAQGLMPVKERYVHGLNAWSEWADVLENRPEKKHYHGNSYAAACFHEARAMASEFLRRLAGRQKGVRSGHLLEASASYGEVEKLLSKYTEIFPFKMQGEMNMEDRIKAANILRKVKIIEEQAIRHLENTLEAW